MTCQGITCGVGQICVYDTVVPNVGPSQMSAKCNDNPCGTAALSCSCASSICTGSAGNPTCMVLDPYLLMCRFDSVCAAPDTLIATPAGQRAIADLRVGDVVYSTDGNSITAVPILRTGQVTVFHHYVVRLALADGSVLEMSPGHPTADGKTFGQLRAGDALDGSAVVSATMVPYRFSRTYDILPASTSATYFAAGHLVGSTLR